MGRKSRKLNFEKDIELQSLSVLLGSLATDKRRISPTRVYELFVVQNRSIVYRTGPIDWTLNGLDDGYKKIRNYYRGTIPLNCSFVLRIWSIIWMKPSATFANLPKNASGLKSGNKPAFIKSFSNRGVRGSKKVPQTGNSFPFNRNAVRTVTGTRVVTSSTGGSTNTYSFPQMEKTVSSVRTPNFKKLERLHQLPQNPYSFRYSVVTPGSLEKDLRLYNVNGSLQSFSNETWSVFQDLPLSGVHASHQSIDDNAIISKLSNSISGPSANIGEDVATARQIIGLFTSKVNLFNAAGRFLATGHLNKWGGVVKKPVRTSLRRAYAIAARNSKQSHIILAQTWLEAMYGWKPLLGDIEALWNAFIRLHTKSTPVLARRVAKKAKRNEYTVDVTGYTDQQPLVKAGGYYVRHDTTKKFIVYYQLDSVLTNVLANLGATSPVSLGWELVPFSFVVDWFYPIGNALNAYHAFEGLTFKSGCTVQFSKQYVTYRIAKSVSGPAIPNVQLGYTATAYGDSIARSVLYTRTPLTGFPSPKWPVLKNPISVVHALNALALTTVLLTGRRRS